MNAAQQAAAADRLRRRLSGTALAQIHAAAPRLATDFQTPYNLKLLSGGTISGSLSYYLYFFLYERGEVGGIEDAFVYANDIAGKPVDIMVGQFQVSDPLFKRELRLEYQDYAIYRARIGDQVADLTYDRGVMATADFAGFTLTAPPSTATARAPRGTTGASTTTSPRTSWAISPGTSYRVSGWECSAIADSSKAPQAPFS